MEDPGLNPHQPRRTWCGVPAILFAAGALAVVYLPIRTPAGFTLDDGWIHLTYARNLARTGVWGFNTDQPSAGASSTLWVFLLAAGFLISDRGVITAYVLNLAAFLALAALVGRIACELGRNRRHRALIVILTIGCGNLLWYVGTGMETLVLLVAGLTAIWASTANRVYLTAAAAFVAAVTRPEGFIVGLAIAVWHLRHGRARTGGRHVHTTATIAAAVGFIVAGLWQYHVCGRFLPATMLGRSWIVDQPPGITLNPLTIIANLFLLIGTWGYRLMEFSLGQAALTDLGISAAAAWTFAALGAVVMLIGFFVYLTRMGAIGAILLLWTVLHTVTYAMILPTRGHAGRYQPMVLIVAMLCLALGILWLIERTTWGAIPAVMVILLAAGSTCLWRGIVRDSGDHFQRVHVAAGRWLRENTPRDTTVAAFDIGAVGYVSEREIIDISGLLDPDAGRALYAGTMGDYLRRRRPDMLAMIFPGPDPLQYYHALHLDEHAMVFQKAFRIDIPEVYWPGEAARVLADEIRIYRMHWRQ